MPASTPGCTHCRTCGTTMRPTAATPLAPSSTACAPTSTPERWGIDSKRCLWTWWTASSVSALSHSGGLDHRFVVVALEVPARDVVAGGQPDALPAGDVLERPVQVSQPERHPGEEGMKRDGHHLGARLSGLVERVELIHDHLAEVWAAHALVEEQRNVVDLDRVGHRDQPAVLDPNRAGLIVVAPVADVAEPKLGEELRRVRALGQERPQPALRALSGVPLDRLHHLGEVAPLFFERHVGLEGRVVLSMADPGPSAAPSLLDDLRVALAHIGVQQHARRDVVALEDLHEPPEPDPRAVVAPARVEGIGNELRRPGDDADPRLVGLVVLDVHAHPERHASTVGQLEAGTANDRPVFEAAHAALVPVHGELLPGSAPGTARVSR